MPLRIPAKVLIHCHDKKCTFAVCGVWLICLIFKCLVEHNRYLENSYTGVNMTCLLHCQGYLCMLDTAKNICAMKNFMLNCDILTFFLCYGIC